MVPGTIRITREDIDPGKILQEAQSSTIGALVSFLGVVRDDGIERMDLEAYEEVAEEELARIREQAIARFAVSHVDIIHRVGMLSVGDHIVMIVVGASHRKAAFQGCEFIIDRIKESVPIWKKEYTTDGSRWVAGEHG
ncbi:MAG: molybdopterin guanine dinucleotide biosynthesis protein MoaE [Methanoregulaceae archaeon PtaU1.Bin059]|nr:MAG: molybdopterin guanine dinucleotide biosynthesis protein MoaE [Methanoregulaceae archaeon PtaB.Bin152]OPY42869.1 MAG: molybdopterin guanine dinucleotide biosynthesis protein MoaE [Methanoregulaceae archaeon PtaU1.Bin059]